MTNSVCTVVMFADKSQLECYPDLLASPRAFDTWRPDRVFLDPRPIEGLDQIAATTH